MSRIIFFALIVFRCTYLSAQVDSTVLKANDITADSMEVDSGQKGILSILQLDSNLVLTGGLDNSIKLWNIQKLKEIAVIRYHNGPVFSMALSKKLNKFFTASWDGNICSWDINDCKLDKIICTCKDSPRIIKVSANEKYLIAGFENGAVKIWDISENNKLILDVLNDDQTVNDLAFSDNSNYFAFCCGGLLSGCVYVYNLNGELLSEASSAVSNINSLSFGAYDTLLYYGDSDGNLWKLNLNSGNTFKIKSINTNCITLLKYLRENNNLLSVAWDGFMRLFSFPEILINKEAYNDKSWITGIIFIDNNNVLISTQDSRLRKMKLEKK